MHFSVVRDTQPTTSPGDTGASTPSRCRAACPLAPTPPRPCPAPAPPHARPLPLAHGLLLRVSALLPPPTTWPSLVSLLLAYQFHSQPLLFLSVPRFHLSRMDAPMAAALGGEDLEAAKDLAVGVAAAAAPAEAAESLATAAAVLGASVPAAGEAVGGAVVASTAAPPAGLFGPHFLLRAASHLVYVTFTAAILFQVYVLGGIASLLSLLRSMLSSALAPVCFPIVRHL